MPNPKSYLTFVPKEKIPPMPGKLAAFIVGYLPAKGKSVAYLKMGTEGRVIWFNSAGVVGRLGLISMQEY